ncbi:adenosylcobinamide amidohydrolase|uniref:Adenosylcobinamide amidohydrolase n=1 Tax=Dendrosporobacter quercicolus TaxID=146817 RepID=A0A1G9QU06_9FIRM|nr:adenosylcobinamide amidohydrolase [Dendrosporobacter quercicolus]NSL48363.1 adenosylcobinamide amidohydrolase [Dendrosporobacter quercicolus DSM 1736]SDM14486.1 Adenosylcobinamide amidohydrolase [Dendrosporobacter quercicolus]
MSDAAEVTLHTLSTGDSVVWNKVYETVAIKFNKARKVLSTSQLNGGYREDLQGVLHYHQALVENGDGSGQAEKSRAWLRSLAAALALDPGRTAAMGTSGSMENTAIAVKQFQTLIVTAMVIAGIEPSAVRAGSLPRNAEQCRRQAGPVNIILLLDADMPPGTVARALVTCSEAKTAALQELMADSVYSCGLATGTGADQTMVLANAVSPLYLETAGKHSKLGELIGQAVKQAVQEALVKQGGISPQSQRSLRQRFQRFGFTDEFLWRQYASWTGRPAEKARFQALWDRLDGNPALLAYSSLYIHLLDQQLWGLLPAGQVQAAGQELIAAVAARCCVCCPVIPSPKLQDCLQAWFELIFACLVRQPPLRPEE